MISLLFLWSIGMVWSVPELLRFQVQPISQTISDQGRIRLRCEGGRGTDVIAPTWYRFSSVKIPPTKESILLNGYARSSITVTMSRSDTDVLFQCSIQSKHEIIYSDVALITVTYFSSSKPPIPERFIIIEDMLASVVTKLDCNEAAMSVSSNTNFEIVWYKNGQELNDEKLWASPAESDLTVMLRSSNREMMGSVKQYDLVMYNVMMSDGGTYYCKARQGKMQILLATYTVYVRREFSDVEYFITQPVVGYFSLNVAHTGMLDGKVYKGDSITLGCGGIGYCGTSLIGVPRPFKYQWLLDGEVVSHDKTFLINIDQPRRYVCLVTCSEGKASTSLDITLAERDITSVVFTKTPPPFMTYIYGESVGDLSVQCEIESLSKYQITFYRNGYPISMPVPISQVLTVKSGVIQCAVTDSINTVFVQHTIQLNIIDKAAVQLNIKNYTLDYNKRLHVLDGESVEFWFHVTGTPAPTSTLSTNRERGDICDRGTRLNNEVCTESKGNTYKIKVTEFTKDNEAIYTLSAKSQYYTSNNGDLVVDEKSAMVKLSYAEQCSASITISPTTEVLIYTYGTKVRLQCISRGYPRPNLYFIRDGILLGQWESACKKEDGKITCTKLLSRYSDIGQYGCSSFNIIRGIRTDCNTTNKIVTFAGDPVVDSVNYLINGDQLVARCIVEGNPHPGVRQVNWYYNGSMVESRLYKSSEISVYKVISKLELSEWDNVEGYKCCFEARKKVVCQDLILKSQAVAQEAVLGAVEEKWTLGIIIGVICLVIIIAIIVIILLVRRRRRNRENKTIKDTSIDIHSKENGESAQSALELQEGPVYAQVDLKHRQKKSVKDQTEEDATYQNQNSCDNGKPPEYVPMKDQAATLQDNTYAEVVCKPGAGSTLPVTKQERTLYSAVHQEGDTFEYYSDI